MLNMFNTEKEKYYPIEKESIKGFNDKHGRIITEFCTKADFRVYRDYTRNGLFEKLNNALRFGYADSVYLLDVIRNLDELFAEIPNIMRPHSEIRVYRGTSLHDDLEAVLFGKIGSDIYVDKGFVSTSKDVRVAKQFATAAEGKGILLDITIPKGVAVIDNDNLPSYAGSFMKNEREVLLPRNAQFRILSYDEKSRVVKALYLGQKQPLELPKVFEYSGSDILSDMNKGLLNYCKEEKFIFDKYNKVSI